MTYLGKIGDPLDRGITLRDLVDSGIVTIANLASAKTSSPLNLDAGIKTLSGGTPDLTPPPIPTGFSVSAAITSVFIQHDAPLYTQGHGHLRTHVYGVVRAPNDPLPTFSSATEIQQFTGTVSTITTNPATTWHLWIKWETVDGVLSASPAGGINGLSVTTGQDVSLLLQALTGKITESQLYETLGKRIALVDGPATLQNSVAYLIQEEATLRASAITAESTNRTNAITTATNNLQSQINTITAANAGDVGSLISAIQTEQAARNAADLTFSGQVNTLTAVANNEQAAIKTEETIRSTQDFAQATQTSLLIAQTGQNTAGLSTETAVRSTADSAQTAQTATLFTATGQNLAGLQTETTSRSTADSAQAAQTSYLVAKTSDTTAAVLNEATVRSTADSANASQITSLTTTTGQTYAGLLTETNARTTDASAQAAQTSFLSAAVNANTAGLLTEANARTTDASAQAAQTALLSAAVNANTSGLLSEANARATDASAQAAQTSLLYAAVGANTAGLLSEANARATDTFSQASQTATALASAGNSLAATNTETQLRATADSANASQINQLQVSSGINTSGLSQERTLSATDSQALASQVTAVTAATGSNLAALQTEQTARTTDSQSFASQVTGIAAIAANSYSSISAESSARATADSAVASTITTLQSTAASNASAITNEAITRASADSALSNSLTTLSSSFKNATISLPLDQWVLNGQSIVTLTDGKAGTTALRLSGLAGAYPNQGTYIPINSGKKYRVRFWARPSSNCSGLLYFDLCQFTDNAGTPGPVNGGRSPYKPSAQTRAGHIATYGDTWGEYNYLWDDTDWQTGVKYFRPEFLDNYSNQVGYWDIQGFTLYDVTDIDQVSATLVTNYLTKADTNSAISSATTGLVSSTALTTKLADYTTTTDLQKDYATKATLTTNYYTKTDTSGAISTATTNLSARISAVGFIYNPAFSNGSADGWSGLASVTNAPYGSMPKPYAGVQTGRDVFFPDTSTETWLACSPTEQFEVSAWVSAQYTSPRYAIGIQYERTNGDTQTWTVLAEATAPTGAVFLKGYWTAPADARRVRFWGQIDTFNTENPWQITDAQLRRVDNRTGANATAIDVLAKTTAGADGTTAQYTVKVDTNGYVSGFGLSSTSRENTPSSSFAVRADAFYIASPSGPSISPTMPFIVRTSATKINGVDVPAGVYITDGYIQNGTITNAKIADAAIDSAKVASLSADKITAGSLQVGQYIQSTTFTSGTSGWKINADGTAEFGSASIRGQLAASQIDTRGLSIKDTDGNVILSAGSSLATSSFNGNVTGSISGTTASTVLTNITAAATAASSAATAASSAQTTANSAATAASSAATAASSAATAASSAQTTANSAATAASSAQTTANSAATAASSAQTTANSAATAAAAAQTAAAAAQTAADAKLAKSGAQTLTGPVTLNAASAITVGTPALDSVSGHNGLYMGNTGIVGTKDGKAVFVLDNAGNAIFKGDITGANGNFTGSLNGANITGATGTFTGTLQAGTIDVSKLVGQTSRFSTAGTYTATCPADFTQMRVTLVGGGGGGYAKNGGGGGGVYVGTFTVSSGTTVTVNVGAGGSAGNSGGGSSVTNYASAGGGGGATYSAGGAGGSGTVSGFSGGVGGTNNIPVDKGYVGVDYYGSGGASGSNYGAGGAPSTVGNPYGGGGGAGAAGASGLAIIEFFNPNGVIIRSEWNTLISALQRQGLATS